MKKTGVKDIAILAGVSTGTVDRVLNKRGRVSEKTREKVLRIAGELGYQPNLLAKSLSSKKRLRFAVVIPESHENNPYWEIPIHGIDRARDELKNYNVDVTYRCYDASNESSFKSVLEEVIGNGVDGLVFSPFYEDCSVRIAERLNDSDIPFVFVDVNVKGVGKLAYFGQDSKKSGEVAGMLMVKSLKKKSNVLVVKQARKKVFSNHLEDRVIGFLEFLKNTSIQSDVLEIDLENKNEPHQSLQNKFGKKNHYHGVFIPNSRGFKVVNFLEQEGIEGLTIIGYDLVKENVKHLENDKMTFLLHQKPKEQTYNAVMALFNHLIFKKEIEKTNYSPIDIVIKQNVEYFK